MTILNDVPHSDAPALGVNESRGGMERRPPVGAVVHPSVVFDVEAALLDVRINEMYSDTMAFRVAASMAFRNAFKQADPILLEPIMKTDILIPEEFMGEVIGDLNSRLGKIEQVTTKGPVQDLTAKVPLSKMFGYSTALRSVSQGRGTFSMQFSHYDNVQ